MPVLTQGQAVTLHLSARQVLKVTPTVGGYATVSGNGPFPGDIIPQRMIGGTTNIAFNSDVDVTIAAVSGACSYSTPSQATAVGVRSMAPLVHVACGNSIAKNGQWVTAVEAGASGGFSYSSEWAFANKLYPLGWNTTRMSAVSANAAATTVDIMGNYGYSGAESHTILADWGTNWFPNTDTAGICPGLVSAVDLFINDITVGGVSLGVLQKRFFAIDEALRAKWGQGIIVEYCTPHPSTNVNTAALKRVFNDFSDWMVGTAHNGVTRLVTDLRDPDGYSDPSDRTVPLGTAANIYFTQVHPDQGGASINGRLIARTRRAAFGDILPQFTVKPYKSANQGMTGSSNVAAVTGFTGTRPGTAWGTPTALTTAGECVCTASNPGAWNIVWTPTAVSTLGTFQLTNTASMPTGDVAGYAKVRINSGASNVAYLNCNFQQQTAGGATKNYHQTEHGSAFRNFYLDGDVLHLYIPACANPGSLSGIYPTIYMRVVDIGVPVNFDILAAGYIDFT